MSDFINDMFSPFSRENPKENFIYKIENLDIAKTILPLFIERCSLEEKEIVNQYLRDHDKTYKKRPETVDEILHQKDIAFYDLENLFHLTGYDLKTHLYVKEDPLLEDFLNSYTDNIYRKMTLYKTIKHLTWAEISGNIGRGVAYTKKLFMDEPELMYQGVYNKIPCKLFSDIIEYFDRRKCYISYYIVLSESLYFELSNYLISPEGKDKIEFFSTLDQKRYQNFRDKLPTWF